MESYSDAEVIKKLQETDTPLFTLNDIARLFAISRRNTLYKIVQRLEGRGVIKKLIKGKYCLALGTVSEFKIANFLYNPSYISLESALSFYGIITGFPYQITSVSPKKTNNFIVDGKEYSYSRMTYDLFWGYEKKENFLIAEKEKCFLDYLYFAYKGIRSQEMDEFDITDLDKKKLKHYIKRTNKKKFIYFAEKFV